MRGSMVLVDTSVFISHLRGKQDSLFQDLVLNDQIYLSPYVKLELLQGIRRQEMKPLSYALNGLQPLPERSGLMDEAERILAKARGRGLSFGIIDLLLAAQANLERCPVYSFDRIFERLARLRLVSIL